MVFSSVIFIYYFLPFVLVAYYALPTKYKNLFFLSVSLFFYIWGEPIYVLLMLFSIASNYLFGIFMDKYPLRRKAMLIMACVVNLGLLGIFKYSAFFVSNINAIFNLSLPELHITLPLGISFFTFQALSYVIDVYKKDAAPQKNIFDLALYVTAFPQLVAGPIVRYTSFMTQIHQRKHNRVAEGIFRFTIGLSKKIILSNPLGQIADQVFATQASEMSVIAAWAGIIAYTLQIYLDFSGYSDMAIGLGKMFGFEFLENFNYPYISKSVTEFWRRWHISLSTFFRDYVYIPLGGNRCSTARNICNLLVVWLLTGMWHGASWNFIVWGLYYGAFIIFEKFAKNFLLRVPRILLRIYTLLIVMIGWVFFRADTLTQAVQYLSVLFGLGNATLANVASNLIIHDQVPLLIIAIIAGTPLVKTTLEKLFPINRVPVLTKTIISATTVLLLFACTVCLVNSTYNPFIYFRF